MSNPYFLDKKGAELIAQLRGCELSELDWNPKDHLAGHTFLDHLLATNDVRVAIALACQRHGYTIERWLDEKTLKSDQMKDTVILVSSRGARQKASVVPDGYFLLHTGAYRYHQFLEIDRATVTGKSRDWGKRTWARKVAAYLEYYRSGKYQERYQTKNMRILTVTTGGTRLANLKAVTEEAGGKARFWFTTFDQISPETVLTEPIWQVAGKEGLYSLVW